MSSSKNDERNSNNSLETGIASEDLMSNAGDFSKKRRDEVAAKAEKAEKAAKKKMEDEIRAAYEANNAVGETGNNSKQKRRGKGKDCLEVFYASGQIPILSCRYSSKHGTAEIYKNLVILYKKSLL
ncbi:hypothetical protein HYALB_00009807 [Hymenoscyphus albidus]|uniref:Uncharacterized protein n=1 Tax=Hymenoscyphus albidus TaxID=595503 RepID=A0A9N9LG75_9HELO|nr:hypothetical protein HYALB_00009807 [Hymenoscyphus albidus]